MGGSCEFSFRAGYPAVYNDESFTDFVENVLEKNGESLYQDIKDGHPERWLRMNEEPLLGAEDFGFFSQKAPSCMIWIGVGGDAPLHNPEFQIDERYIKLCTRAMATVAMEYLTR